MRSVLEPRGLATGERLAQPGQRGAAPQRERLAQQPGRVLGLSPAGLAGERLEALQIERAVGDAQPVAAPMRLEHALGEDLAEARNQPLAPSRTPDPRRSDPR